jgi:iron complex outermembrane receptor protein
MEKISMPPCPRRRPDTDRSPPIDRRGRHDWRGEDMAFDRTSPRGIGIGALMGTALLGTLPAALHAQPTAPAAAPQAPPQEGLEEIIVTAQRRSENLQAVPIAVTAVTASALENAGINATKDLPQIVPSVQMTRSGPSGLFFVRGVGTTNAAAGEEGANAIYVDGVYLGDLSQTINNFNNIDRVEVLKGPQGTLFGRNATGGLIHIITREPGRDLVVDGQLGYANYDTVGGQLYVGGPLSDTISSDIALTGSHQDDGWGRNLTRNSRNKLGEYGGVRSKTVAHAGETVKLTLSGDYFKSKDNFGLGWRLADGTVGTGGNLPPGGHDTTSNEAALTRLRIWGLSLTAEADLGFADLTSISAMRRNRNHSNFDVDGGPSNLVNIDYVALSRTYQQELRLASNGNGPLSWQFGGFFLRSEAGTDQFQNGLAFAASSLRQIHIVSDLNTDSYAGFGELSYAITPTTKLTGGLRYTKDIRKFDGNQTPMLLTGVELAKTSVKSTLKYGEFTYRLSLRQELTDDINVYGSVNRGFKAGAYSLQSPTSPPVKPQFIMAYEVGLKSQLFDRRLRLNLAAYHYDIDNYQVRSAAAANPGANLLLNAATVKVDGFDAEFQAAPTSQINLFGGFTALKSRYATFGGPGAPFQAPIIYPNPATCPANLRGTEDPGVLGTGPRTGGYTTCFGDVSGNRTPLAPKFAASLGASYKIPVGGTGQLRLSSVYSYNSGYVFEPDNLARQGHYSLLNGSIEYRPNAHWGIELWVKNLTDTDYAVQDLATATGITEVLGAPRTYGVNAKFDF